MGIVTDELYGKNNNANGKIKIQLSAEDLKTMLTMFYGFLNKDINVSINNNSIIVDIDRFPLHIIDKYSNIIKYNKLYYNETNNAVPSEYTIMGSEFVMKNFDYILNYGIKNLSSIQRYIDPDENPEAYEEIHGKMLSDIFGDDFLKEI